MTHSHGLPSGWDRTIADLFAVQARERPHAVAVSSMGWNVSYAELDECSRRIAAWLNAHGVGLEDVVAVEMERGHHLIAALLGILNAGGAYLAVERGTPKARRDQLLAAANVVALITDDGATMTAGLPTLSLPSSLACVDAGSVFCHPGIGPENLAYVSFTSGSTGRPKGVGVPHRGVVRLVAGDFVEFGPDHTFLHLSAVSFDASTLEIWGPLLTGGRLAVAPPGPFVAEALMRVLAEEKVTTLWLTAGLFHRVVDHHLESLADLQQLLAGGDVLDPAHVNRVVARFPNIRLVNGYGPTENTTFTSCHAVRVPVTGAVPIGRPIFGTEVRILDGDGGPVEIGAPGELCVTGAGLSRGYVSAPRATATKFVPDPFSTVGGARMYRTGDLVRRRADGVLEFIGRVDRQVKVRGYRIEPAEIERELTAVAGIAQVVVQPQRDHAKEMNLVAYIVSEPGSDDDFDVVVARARRTLRETLPNYMIPAAFVRLGELPLTLNGKVDMAALPAVDRATRQCDTEYRAPSSATEQLVCDLWSELLDLDRVGVDDDFFELGGNSLRAIDLISVTDMTFEIELPVRSLLYNPTVEEFAIAVDALLTKTQECER